MRDVFATVERWLEEDHPCALATLVRADNSAPAPLGTTIAVDLHTRVVGNIGAGCYEPEIVEACLQTLNDGRFRALPIDLSGDEIEGSPGCGGSLTIAIWKPDKRFAADAHVIACGRTSVTVRLPQAFDFTVPAMQRIAVVGATALAQELARVGRALDMLASVIDPRPPFATHERIPDADELLIAWPDDALPALLERCSALLVISHDPKFDLPALCAGLRSRVPYIGLLGSRRSQAARREALRALGFGDDRLDRIHGPAGLDIGGETPAQTALSMLAHVIAMANERTGLPLDRLSGTIHRSKSAAVSMSI